MGDPSPVDSTTALREKPCMRADRVRHRRSRSSDAVRISWVVGDYCPVVEWVRFAGVWLLSRSRCSPGRCSSSNASVPPVPGAPGYATLASTSDERSSVWAVHSPPSGQRQRVSCDSRVGRRATALRCTIEGRVAPTLVPGVDEPQRFHQRLPPGRSRSLVATARRRVERRLDTLAFLDTAVRDTAVPAELMPMASAAQGDGGCRTGIGG